MRKIIILFLMTFFASFLCGMDHGQCGSTPERITMVMTFALLEEKFCAQNPSLLPGTTAYEAAFRRFLIEGSHSELLRVLDFLHSNWRSIIESRHRDKAME